MQLDLETHKSLDDVRQFLASTPPGATLALERKQAYEHLSRVLRRFAYWKLGKADRGLLRSYLVEFQIDSCGLFQIISCCSGEIFQVDSLLQEGVKGNQRRCGRGRESTAEVFRK